MPGGFRLSYATSSVKWENCNDFTDFAENNGYADYFLAYSLEKEPQGFHRKVDSTRWQCSDPMGSVRLSNQRKRLPEQVFELPTQNNSPER